MLTPVSGDAATASWPSAPPEVKDDVRADEACPADDDDVHRVLLPGASRAPDRWTSRSPQGHALRIRATPQSGPQRTGVAPAAGTALGGGRVVRPRGGTPEDPTPSTRLTGSGRAPLGDATKPVEQGARELLAGADVELREHLAQVILDGSRADEQLGGDLGIGLPLGGEQSDLRLLRSQDGLGRLPVRLRAVSPVASSSRRARSANASVPKRLNI